MSNNTILMCKNAVVYNIDTEEVYNKYLLPGLMIKNPCALTFKLWLKSRYSSNTNTLARQLKGVTFGQGNRVRINKLTHAFSLSDCYWIRQSDEQISFEQLSPYCRQFWSGLGEYAGQAVPTLYTCGYLNKQWVNSQKLYKYGKETLIEEECSKLCQLCNIHVAPVEILDNVTICVYNITSPKLMLEQANQSGRLDPDDFDEKTIARLFGKQGVSMLAIDAIVGNGDRHAGNFGWLRDADTGEYVCMAPLYDFDHALDSKSDSDILIQDTLLVARNNPEYTNELARVATITVHSNTNEIFKRRASTILKLL